MKAKSTLVVIYINTLTYLLHLQADNGMFSHQRREEYAEKEPLLG